MLNLFASLTYYGALAVIFVLAPLMLFFLAKWIIEAWQCNRRAQQWAKRLANTPPLSRNVGQRWCK